MVGDCEPPFFELRLLLSIPFRRCRFCHSRVHDRKVAKYEGPRSFGGNFFFARKHTRDFTPCQLDVRLPDVNLEGAAQCAVARILFQSKWIFEELKAHLRSWRRFRRVGSSLCKPNLRNEARPRPPSSRRILIEALVVPAGVVPLATLGRGCGRNAQPGLHMC